MFSRVGDAPVQMGESAQASGSSRRDVLLKVIRQLSVPIVRDLEVDSKREMDAELKKASEAFITRVSRRALGPLFSFVDAAQEYLKRDDATWEGLAKQDFASASRVRAAVAAVESSGAPGGSGSMLDVVTAARDKAAVYITNPQTRAVLFTAIETNLFKVLNSSLNFAMDLPGLGDDADFVERVRGLVRVAGSAASSSSASASATVAVAPSPPASSP